VPSILKLKHRLLATFNIGFAALFIPVFAAGFIYPRIDGIHQNLLTTGWSLALLTTIVLLFFLAVYRWMGSLDGAVIRRLSVGLFLIIVSFEIWLIVRFHPMIPPIIDGGHTYAEALYLLAHHHASGASYFAIYPNNIPVTLLRYYIYRLAAGAHISNYMVIDWAYCTAMLDLGIFIGWKLVCKLMDGRSAALFLIMTLTCLPFFFYTLYFYTDTAIIAFPLLLLYFSYQYVQSKKISYLLVIGLILGIGDLIRPNLILFFPALIIYLFFVLNWKKVVLSFVIVGSIMGLFSLSAPAVTRHYGYVSNPALSMPTVHWIMLGLSHNGAYNAADLNLTLSQPDQAAKKQADLQQIRQRIRQDGLSGLVRTDAIKAASTWSTGAHGYYFYTHLTRQPSHAYQLLFNDQKQLTVFIIQVFYLVTLILLIFSMIHYFRTRETALNLLIQITLFGNFLFYTFVWEAEPRYSFLFSPFILIGALYGIRELAHAVRRQKMTHLMILPAVRTMKLILAGGLIAVVLITGTVNAHYFIQDIQAVVDYSADQPYANGKSVAAVNAADRITQTFHSLGTFNRIALYPAQKSGSAVYYFSVTNLSTGHILFSKKISSAQFIPNHRLNIGIPNVPGVPAPYRITLSQIRGNSRAKLSFQMSGVGTEQRDLYPGGRLIRSGAKNNLEDLRFRVYHLQQQTYLSPRIYWTLMAVPVVMLLFYGYTTVRLTKKRDSSYILKKQSV
jgi:4-amino-4-deoxy-L-arabinose transferase and related glycosyltransferases of PMT family